jgi:hypothetical protein
MSQNVPDFILLPTQLLSGIAEYLADQPFKSVAGLIQGIQQNGAPVSKADVELINRVNKLSPGDKTQVSSLIESLEPKVDTPLGPDGKPLKKAHKE